MIAVIAPWRVAGLLIATFLFLPSCASAKDTPKSKPVPERPRNLVPLTDKTPLFEQKRAEYLFFRNHRREHHSYGLPRYQRKYRKTAYRKSTIDQRSDRKRMYDHNLLLRGLFAGRLVHKKYGNLRERFVGAAMADIGSAVMYHKGAPTVRDIHEDQRVRPHLSDLIATDINVKGAMIIDQYRKSGRKYPFTVREIPPGILTSAHVLAIFGKDEGKKLRPIFLRSANAGPDLYYNSKQARQHLLATREAFVGRDVIYFFNRFVLFKPAEYHSFQVLGTSAAQTGLNHRTDVWNRIRWSRRSIYRAFRADRKYIVIGPKPKPKTARKAKASASGVTSATKPKRAP